MTSCGFLGIRKMCRRRVSPQSTFILAFNSTLSCLLNANGVFLIIFSALKCSIITFLMLLPEGTWEASIRWDQVRVRVMQRWCGGTWGSVVIGEF